MASADVQSVPTLAHGMVYSPRKPPNLRSNHGNYVSPELTGWMLATSLSTPFQDMRARYERDGYIWIKNLIPREDVLDMREQYDPPPARLFDHHCISRGMITKLSYFTQFYHTGMLLPKTSPRDGIFNRSNDPIAHQGIGAAPEAQTLELLDAVHATSTYREFLAHPALREFVRNFMSWKQEILVERAMLRHNCPGSLSTAVHYDHMFLRGGEAEFLTAWVPIGDCAPAGGGLMYLENSSKLGEEIESEFSRNAEDLSPEERIDAFNKHMTKDGSLSHDAEEFAKVNGEGKLRWLIGDYEAGDVVFHRPYMIHAATKNEDKFGRIRLSSDLRFYEKDAALDERWRKIWRHDDGL